ncbi:MAG: hypothetical protein ACOZAG_02790, partial [Patescibacteria group bacterium]
MFVRFKCAAAMAAYLVLIISVCAQTWVSYGWTGTLPKLNAKEYQIGGIVVINDDKKFIGDGSG